MPPSARAAQEGALDTLLSCPRRAPRASNSATAPITQVTLPLPRPQCAGRCCARAGSISTPNR
ncbi:hypothetical protein B484DRAFT_115194 [Ochromonadaceae sp. CCMP2298]|nr:hypothetical protein B484DRAFT_115194 [Ochromonadaceae sp. CCMP2298]